MFDKLTTWVQTNQFAAFLVATLLGLVIWKLKPSDLGFFVFCGLMLVWCAQ